MQNILIRFLVLIYFNLKTGEIAHDLSPREVK